MSHSSYGEQDITVAHRVVGTVRVLAVFPRGEVFPSLCLRLGVTLREFAPDYHGGVPMAGYEMRDVQGELRLTEHGDALGALRWFDQHRISRSTSPAYESQVEMSVDLDPWRIERMERWRRGEPPRFWLKLWPTVVGSDHTRLEAAVNSFSFAIPRDSWLSVLAGLNVARYSVLEVPATEADAAIFQQAAAHLAKARGYLGDGRYSEAVGACRLAVDAMFSVLGADVRLPLGDHLARLTDERRGASYAKLVSGLKEITHLPHHTSSQPREFRRAEAVFVVQTTQHIVALIGDLRRSVSTSP
jgi:hypothetical protein